MSRRLFGSRKLGLMTMPPTVKEYIKNSQQGSLRLLLSSDNLDMHGVVTLFDSTLHPSVLTFDTCTQGWGLRLQKTVHSSSYYKTLNKLSSRAKDYSPSVMHRRELSRRPMGIQLRLQSRILHLGILRHLHRRGIILGPRRRRGTTRRVALVAAVAAVAIITLRW